MSDLQSAPRAMPEASVIVPSFCGVDRLPALLDSLAAQEDGTPPFEVIVVVDGVDDGSVALLDAETRIDLRAIVFPENRGRVAALNAGFEAARGDVLIRCDDDLVPGPGYVRRHVHAHSDGDIGVVGIYLNVFEPTRYSAVYGEEMDQRFRRDAYSAPANQRWRYWAGNCSITRSLWEQIGEYDPQYRLYGWEDADYGFRLHKAGIEVVLDCDLETVHRAASVSTSIRAKRAAHAAVARRLFDAKHPDQPLPPLRAGGGLWGLAVRMAASTAARRPAEFGAAVDQLIRILPEPLAKKMVALVVESSAVAGYRDSSLAAEVF